MLEETLFQQVVVMFGVRFPFREHQHHRQEPSVGLGSLVQLLQPRTKDP